MAPDASSSHPPGPARAAPATLALLGVLTLLNLLNFVDRYLLKGFAADVVADLNLNYLQFGLLTGVYFSIFYAVSGVLIGMLSDHVSRIRVIAAGVALWSCLTALTGVSRTFLQISSARALIGVGESALTPASLSLLKDVVPARFLSLSTAIYYLGVPLGTGSSLIISGLLGPQLGWRGTFVLLGVVGLLLSVVVLRFPEAPRHDLVRPPAARRISVPATLRALLDALRAEPALRHLILASVLMQFSLGGDSFEQLWLVRERGFDAHRAGIIFGSIYIVVATIALIAGGMLADWLRRRSPAGRIQALLISTAFLVPMVAFRLAPPDSPLFYVLAVLASMFASLTIGPYYAAIQELSPPGVRATVLAFVLLVTTLLGFGLGSAAFGALSDALAAADISRPLTISLAVQNSCGLLSIPFIVRATLQLQSPRAPAAVLAQEPLQP